MIIGSTAIKHWFPDFPREPKDLDTISKEKIDGADNFWHESFPDEWSTKQVNYATPSFLYTLKVSHSFWDIHGTWDKHMYDIVFLRDKGAMFDREWYDILLPVWTEIHGKKKANLSQTKDDFFDDAVHRKYDHDSIHDSVAYGERPLYEKILRGGAEVAVDKAKFEALTYDEKLKLVREEVYATALERWIIPTDYRFSPRAAYARAMKKTVTSLFRGDWALWISLHYKELRQPDMDYVQHHRSKSHKLILL